MKNTSNTYFGRYRIYLRMASTGLLIAPFSSQLWDRFIDSLVDVVMTLVTFAFLLACICVYPVAVALFALFACEGDRLKAKRDEAYWSRMSKEIKSFSNADKVEFLDDTDGRCDKGSPQGLHGWYCSRDKGHDGPCALRKADK